MTIESTLIPIALATRSSMLKLPPMIDAVVTASGPNRPATAFTCCRQFCGIGFHQSSSESHEFAPVFHTTVDSCIDRTS